MASTLIRRFPQGVIDQTTRAAEQPDSGQATPLALVQPRATASARELWSDPTEPGQRPSALAQRAADTSLDLLRPARATQASQPPLQRVIAETRASDQSGSASGASPSASPDIEALARQVYSRLRRRLRIEAERLGK